MIVGLSISPCSFFSCSMVLHCFQRNLLPSLSFFLSMYHLFFGSLSTFRIFSLSLVLSNFIVMCLGVVFFIFLYLKFMGLYGSVHLQFSSNLEAFHPLFLQTFVLPFFRDSNYRYIKLLEIVSFSISNRLIQL